MRAAPEPLTVARALEPHRGLARTLCDRIEEKDAEVGAFVPEPDRRTRVKEALATAADGPLHGLPVAVKDVIAVDGLATRAGSRLPPEQFEMPEAEAVRRMREAGAVVVGKTETAEFAWVVPPRTRNPLDLERTPGGSSSGSAAAVAAGMCALALGTQTIGSVIRPASYCGIVGFKPTFGRVPVSGVVACSPSLDTVGWFASDVAGVGAAAAVLCGGWRDVSPRPQEPGAPTAQAPVLGVPEGPFLEAVDPGTQRLFHAQILILAARGFRVRRVRVLDDIDDITGRHRLLAAAEMADVHSAWFDEHEHLYGAPTADTIRRGRTIDARDADRARAGRAELADRLAEAGVDVWLSPAAPGPAPVGLSSTGDPSMNLPWTYAGVPVITLPVGQVDDMPVGLQIAGRLGADEELLALAADIAEAL